MRVFGVHRSDLTSAARAPTCATGRCRRARDGLSGAQQIVQTLRRRFGGHGWGYGFHGLHSFRCDQGSPQPSGPAGGLLRTLHQRAHVSFRRIARGVIPQGMCAVAGGVAAITPGV